MHAIHLIDRIGDLADTLPRVADGRLSLVSGQAVPTGDVADADTLYYTAHRGPHLALYHGSHWRLYRFGEPSLPASGLSADTIHDVFAYHDGASVALSSVAWANSDPGTSARGTSLTRQDGVRVLSSDATRRYVGSIRTDAAGHFHDTESRRLVYNLDNPVRRSLRMEHPAGVRNWVEMYPWSGWKYANDRTDWKIDLLAGQPLVVHAEMDIGVEVNNPADSRPMFQVAIDEVGSDEDQWATFRAFSTNTGQRILSAKRHETLAHGIHIIFPSTNVFEPTQTDVTVEWMVGKQSAFTGKHYLQGNVWL